MPTAQANAVLGYIRKLAAEKTSQLADRELVRRFVTQGEEAAFAALVHRHGPMVFRLCLRILRDEQDAEDAFQAVFLVLSRKAASLQRQESVGSWLYAVAQRLALKAKTAAARRHVHEGRVAKTPVKEPLAEITVREAQEILDQELAHLPEKYRAPLVLCCLEGLSRDEAAHQLGCALGTLKNRLEQARERLHARLACRGLALSGAFTALLLDGQTAAAVPAALAASTIKAATTVAMGNGATGLVSAKVVALAEGVVTTMFMSKLCVATVLVSGVLFVAAAGMLGFHAAAADQPAAPAAKGQSQANPTGKQIEAPRRSLVTANSPPPAAAEPRDSLSIKGRVLAPDGKPLAGASVFLARETNSLADIVERTTSGEDGGFRITVDKTKLTRTRIVATAEGHGFDFVDLGEPQHELTLRLVKDVPIRGRIVDVQGKAVVGADVGVLEVFAPPSGTLDAYVESIQNGTHNAFRFSKVWHAAIPGQPSAVRTDAQGRFVLTGVGQERFVLLKLIGNAIEHNGVYVLTRDTKPIAMKTVTQSGHFFPPRNYYGATFDHVPAPSRRITGVVRDKETGKPVAGVKLRHWHLPTSLPVTGDDGRYELVGHPKGPRYDVEILDVPASYFLAHSSAPDTDGLGPIQIDFDLVRGISARGRVVGKAGKPIKGHVAYYTLFPNEHISKLGNQVQQPAGKALIQADGSFSVPVLPGPGVLAVRAEARHEYQAAEVTAKQIEEFFKVGYRPLMHGGSLGIAMGGPGGQTHSGMGPYSYNAVALINPQEGDKTLTRDFTLQPVKGSGK